MTLINVRVQASYYRQRGSVLIVALVMLLLMSLLAIASMQGTVMQDQMTGNMHNHDLAFQAAEAALRAGESYVESNQPLPNVTNSSGLYDMNDPHTPNWMGSTLSDGSGAFTYSGTLAKVAKQPEYYIERIATVQPSGSSIEAGTALPTTAYYRITALGYGGTKDSIVVLSSIYRTY